MSRDTENGYSNGHSNGRNNGHYNSPPQGKEPAWRNAIRNFTGIWWTIAMDTGILSLIMHQLPYQFNGLPVLSTIMYVFLLVQCVVFGIMTILHWTMFPSFAKKNVLSEVDQLCMLAAMPIAFLTFSSLTAVVVSGADWGHHAFTIVGYVMWWIVMAWMVVTTFGIYITIFRTKMCDDRSSTPTLCLPTVGIATAAVSGAVIVNYSYHISARLAVPVIIVCYFLCGFTLWLALIVYSIFTHRLMAVGWPPAVKVPSMMLLVGLFGQSAAAVIYLGTAANKYFGSYHRGTFLQSMSGSSVSAASTLIGLLLLGLDFFWVVVAVFSILEYAFKKQTSYALTWWATIFPLATMTTAFSALANEMDSPTFRVLTCIFLIILLINYFINWGFTIFKGIKGNLLIKRGEEEQQQKEQEKGD